MLCSNASNNGRVCRLVDDFSKWDYFYCSITTATATTATTTTTTTTSGKEIVRAQFRLVA